jgi:uncharacterized membrane protein
LTNWGVTIVLAMLLSFSEYLGRTKRFKENSVIDFVEDILKKMLDK